MNYHEKLGKLYHQLMLNKIESLRTSDNKEKKWECFSKEIELKRNIETLMTEELHKENPNVIGVCNVRPVSVHYSIKTK